MIKNRNIVLCIVFSIITCGIYSIYWLICLNNDMNTLTPGDDFQTSGGLVFLFSLITCGIYGIYWSYQMGQKMNMLTGDTNNHILFLILDIFQLSIVNFCLMQSEINKHATVVG
jgi:hypothetical protein